MIDYLIYDRILEQRGFEFQSQDSINQYGIIVKSVTSPFTAVYFVSAGDRQLSTSIDFVHSVLAQMTEREVTNFTIRPNCK